MTDQERLDKVQAAYDSYITSSDFPINGKTVDGLNLTFRSLEQMENYIQILKARVDRSNGKAGLVRRVIGIC